MSEQLIDTHCHIQSAGLTGGERTTSELWAKAPDLQQEDIIAAAREAGVTRMVAVGCTLEDSRLAVDCAAHHDSVWASIGLHPHEARHYVDDQEAREQFAQLASRPKVVAIGECGLDYFYNHSPKEEQLAILKFQLELAQANDLPVIFHVREAFDDFWPVFESYTGIRGVLHSFTDSKANLERAVGHGLSIGVNGIATFAKKLEQLDVYRSIPLESLVLETDAPFLTPTPYRGKICEPKYVRVTAEFLAELRGENVEDLARITTRSAQKLFGI